MRPVEGQPDRNGGAGIRAKELRELLLHFGVAGEQRAFLILLADPRGAYGWHRDYADVLPSAWRDYFVLETAALKIFGYEAQQVPGLLQTPAYARALAQTDPSLTDDAARDRAAEAVMARQEAILGGEVQPEIHLIIGEAALRQEVGSRAVMDQQLRLLARAAEESGNLTLQFCRSTQVRTPRRGTGRWGSSSSLGRLG